MYAHKPLVSAVAAAIIIGVGSGVVSAAGSLTVGGQTYSLDSASVSSDGSGLQINIEFSDSDLGVTSSSEEAGSAAPGDENVDNDNDNGNGNDNDNDNGNDNGNGNGNDNGVAGRCDPPSQSGTLGRQERTSIPANEVFSIRMPAGQSGMFGQATTVPQTGTYHARTTWVSECPGGEPLSQTHPFFRNNVCTSSATETSLRWGFSESGTSCSLVPGTQYYFNVRWSRSWDGESETTCPSSRCGFYYRTSIN